MGHKEKLCREVLKPAVDAGTLKPTKERRDMTEWQVPKYLQFIRGLRVLTEWKNWSGDNNSADNCPGGLRYVRPEAGLTY